MNNILNQTEALQSLVGAANGALCTAAVDAALPAPRLGAPADAEGKWVRPERGTHGTYYYRTAGGERRTLGVPGNQPDLAKEVLKLRRLEERGLRIGAVNPDAVRLDAVLSHYLSQMKPGEGAPHHAKRDYKALQATFDRMLTKFGKDVTCGEIGKMSADAYIDWRTSEEGRLQVDTPNGTRLGKLVKPVTAAYEIRKARAAGEAYSTVCPRPIRLFRGDLPRAEARPNWLTQDELVRLVLSAWRGWIWDEDANGWLTVESVDPETGRTVRRKAVDARFAREGARAVYEGRILARAILFLYYTGSRSMVVERLRWDFSKVDPYLDVARGILHRRGIDGRAKARPRGRTYKKNKLHPPVFLPRPLLRLLKAAKANDARVGARFFLHDQFAPGKPLRQGLLLYRVKRAARLAGLENVNVHTLRHTTCTTLLRRGCRIEDVAAFVGASVQVIRETYGHVDLEATWAGALLMAEREFDPAAMIDPGRPHPLTLVRMRDADADVASRAIREDARRKRGAERSTVGAGAPGWAGHDHRDRPTTVH